jgi:outer membrane protein assembly factor BamD (BamD/ComL family)
VGLIALMLLTACSTVPRDRTPLAGNTALVEQPDREADRFRAANRAIGEGDRLLRDAEAKLRAGSPAAAIRILEDLVRRFPDGPFHDRALYELASALVLTGNASWEYLPAVAPLDRLLREHPGSSYAADARALRMVIGAYVARTAERDRLIKQLKAVDLEFERPPAP